MTSQIEGDQYIRTLAHHLRSNEFRFTTLPAPNARPSKSLSYHGGITVPGTSAVGNVLGGTLGMMTSLFTVPEALSSTPPSRRSSTGPERSPSLVPSVSTSTSTQSVFRTSPQQKVIPLILDPIHLYFLLVQFESLGLDIGEPALLGTIPKNGIVETETTPRKPTGRANSINSIASNISNLSLSSGWSFWSARTANAPSYPGAPTQPTLQDEIVYIYKVFSRISGLRLQQNMAQGIVGVSGSTIAGRRVITNYENVTLSPGSSILLSTNPFRYLTHLEIKELHPRVLDGWQALQSRLVVLIVWEAGIEDVGEVVLDTVMDGLRRRGRLTAETTKENEKNEDKNDAAATPPLSSTTIATKSAINQPAYDLAALLAPQAPWANLKHLSLAKNQLTQLSSHPCGFVMSLTHLDLSHNMLVDPPAALSILFNLRTLNLAYNMINHVSGINTILGSIEQLDLRGNRIVSLCGLERLWALEGIDLRENQIEEWGEVGRLAGLPALKEVWVEGNPFCISQPNYRVDLFSSFRSNDLEVLLDGYGPSFTERRQIHVTPRAENAAEAGALAAVLVAFPTPKPSPSEKTRTISSFQSQSPRPSMSEMVSTRPAKGGKRKVKRFVDLDEEVKKDDNTKASVPSAAATSGNSEVAAAKKLMERHNAQNAVAADTAFSSSPMHSPTSATFTGPVPSKSTSTSRRPVHRLQELEQSVALPEEPSELIPSPPSQTPSYQQKRRSATYHGTGTGTGTGAGTGTGTGAAGTGAKNHRRSLASQKSHPRRSSITKDRKNSNTGPASEENDIPKTNTRKTNTPKTTQNNTITITASPSSSSSTANPPLPIRSKSPALSLRSSSSITSGGSGSGALDLEPVDQQRKGDDFRRKIEAMRSEAGPGWLRVLGEMQQGAEANRGVAATVANGATVGGRGGRRAIKALSVGSGGK